MWKKVVGTDHRFCDRITRRRMIRIGGTGLLGGLTLPHLLNLQASAASATGAKAKACIFLMLEGGPSHIDMWDLKPDAPAEIRGPFKPISTVVPGTHIGQILPLCSKIVDKITILRRTATRTTAIQTGRHWVLTGYPPSFADGQAKGVPFNELYPSIGSIVSCELGPGGHVPPYVEVPNALGPGGPGFYRLRVRTVHDRQRSGAVGFPGARPGSARSRSAAIDSRDGSGCCPAPISWERTGATGPASTMGSYYEQAIDLVTSPKARKAFNIQAEDPAMRGTLWADLDRPVFAPGASAGRSGLPVHRHRQRELGYAFR